MNSEASIQGAVFSSTVDLAMTMKWQVTGVDQEGTAEMSQAIERMKMTMETPGLESVTYDSASKDIPTGPAKSVAEGIGPLLGVKFIQRMNDRGEIIDVRLSEEASQALDEVPSGAELKEMFSKEGLKSLVNQAAAVLPQQPVRPGDTWQGKSQVASPAGELTMDIKYTYLGTEVRQARPQEKIGVNLALSFPEGTNPLGLSVNIKDQNSSGVLYFDATEGRFVETQLRQQMTMETALGDHTHQQKLDMRLNMQFVSDRVARPPAQAVRAATARPGAAPRGTPKRRQ
jgi:hypothetical protein